MYKIDNKNQKTKFKNLEQSLDFQKYNIKEKKQKEKRKQEKNKKKKTPQEYFIITGQPQKIPGINNMLS